LLITKELKSGRSFKGINKKLSELLDSKKKVDQLRADWKIVTLETQLHQAVLIEL